MNRRTSYLLIGAAVGAGVLAIPVVLLMAWLMFAGARDELDFKSPKAADQAEPASSDVAASVASSSVEAADLRDKLQAIAFAFLLHNDHFRLLSHPTSDDEFGSQLSWRVHLLPFLGEQELYGKFRLNEAWDSPHNQALLPEIPEVYRFDDSENTQIRVFAGPAMLFRNRPTAVQNISDGPSNTVLALAVGKNLAVPWTHPGGLSFSSMTIAELMSGAQGKPIEAVTADGSLLTIPPDVSTETLTALITPIGNEVFDAESLRKTLGPQPQPDPALTSQVQTAMKLKNDRMTKLKEIALAMHNYHDTYNRFPPAQDPKLYDAQGKPNLSWRVQLLPFLGHGPLYDEFKLDEPWDSPHNAKLIELMPDVFRDPQDPLEEKNTRFMTIAGPETAFSGPQGPRMMEFRDGTASTIMVVIAGRDKAAAWTKPEDIAVDPEAPVACLGDLDGPGIYYVKMDGAVGLIKSSVPARWFQALVSPAGGEVLPRDLANYGWR